MAENTNQKKENKMNNTGTWNDIAASIEAATKIKLNLESMNNEERADALTSDKTPSRMPVITVIARKDPEQAALVIQTLAATATPQQVAQVATAKYLNEAIEKNSTAKQTFNNVISKNEYVAFAIDTANQIAEKGQTNRTQSAAKEIRYGKGQDSNIRY